MNHAEFEKKLIEMLLAGDDLVLKGLRNQYLNSKVESREFTGAGFYTDFKTESNIPPVAKGKSFQIGDVFASMGNIKAAFGFILFIEKGYLSLLEGYTLSSDVWPNEYSNILLDYHWIGDRLENQRDFEKLRAKWK
jgi:hypothetical protein